VPEWLPALIAQIPLVSAVAYGFMSRRLRTAGEVDEWRQRWIEERADRKEAERHLAETTTALRAVLEAVNDLAKEVIRRGPG
jgi:hypothetical protein